MKTAIFTVEGMSCNHCVDAITQGMKVLKGVVDVNVNLEKRSVQVDYDEREIDPLVMEKAIEELGYDVKGTESY